MIKKLNSERLNIIPIESLEKLAFVLLQWDGENSLKRLAKDNS